MREKLFRCELLLFASNGLYFREGELKDDLLLVVHHVDPGPVDGDDELVPGQLGPARPHRLVESGEQQRPLEPGEVDHVLLHADIGRVLLHVVALQRTKNIFYPSLNIFLPWRGPGPRVSARTGAGGPP